MHPLPCAIHVELNLCTQKRCLTHTRIRTGAYTHTHTHTYRARIACTNTLSLPCTCPCSSQTFRSPAPWRCTSRHHMPPWIVRHQAVYTHICTCAHMHAPQTLKIPARRRQQLPYPPASASSSSNHLKKCVGRVLRSSSKAQHGTNTFTLTLHECGSHRLSQRHPW